MSNERIIDRVRALAASSDADVVAVYIFGSVARRTDSPDSDVDVAVLLRPAAARGLGDARCRLEGEIERTLGRRAHVVVLNTAPPDLVHRVLRDGELLVERNRSARIAFEVRSRNQYFDLLPILNRYRQREVVRR